MKKLTAIFLILSSASFAQGIDPALEVYRHMLMRAQDELALSAREIAKERERADKAENALKSPEVKSEEKK